MRFSKIKDNDIANGIGITMSLWTKDAHITVRAVLMEKRGTLIAEKSSEKKI